MFALLRGQLGQDAGDCLLPADWRIAHMRQEVDTLDRLAVDYVLDGDSRLREIQAALAAAEAAHDGSALARLHTELDNADGYTADARRASCWPDSASAASRWSAGSVISPAVGGCA